MVLELSSSPRSVTVMDRLVRLTVAVIFSGWPEAVNFHNRPLPMTKNVRNTPPAQNVLRRYGGTIGLGVLSLLVPGPLHQRSAQASSTMGVASWRELKRRKSPNCARTNLNFSKPAGFKRWVIRQAGILA